MSVILLRAKVKKIMNKYLFFCVRETNLYDFNLKNIDSTIHFVLFLMTHQ